MPPRHGWRRLTVGFLIACTGTGPATDTLPGETDPPVVTVEPTQTQLDTFYAANGGREAFPDGYRDAIEALLLSQDDVTAGDYASARARIDAMFAQWPLSTDSWLRDARLYDLNVGNPIAYYGLRMLDQIVEAGPQPTRETLRMTAVVATCATVRRPTLPDFAPETVELEIHPDILADDARVLHQSTDLFRRWVKAITRGSEVELVVHPMSTCATVDFTVREGAIVSYPDSAAMVADVPEAIADGTDLWWVVAPSGVPGDGSGFDRDFITGGMGGVRGAPLFLSDDGWFVRKPSHLGTGPYSDVERRLYQPQWFQHEFMHHLFHTWPEYALEAQDHQWFDRSTWPDDFTGRWEPDYYYEAVEKRLLQAEPSLAEALNQPDPIDVSALDREALAGRYQHEPRQNDWHDVEVIVDGQAITWTNSAGALWSLEIRGTELWSGADCPYGEQELGVEVDGNGGVAALRFQGGRYARP